MVSACAVVAALLAVLASLVWSSINYDEGLHAHALWLVSEGKRPFHDFVAMYLPWCWYLVQPAALLLDFDPTTRWLGLRVVGCVPLLVTVAFVVVPGSVAGRPFRWMVGALVVASPPMCAVATEFRPDSWSYPLLVIGTATIASSARDRRAEGVVRAACGAFVVVIGLSFTPKWIVWAPAFVVALFVLDGQARRQARGIAIGIAGGIVFALLLLGAILTVADIDHLEVWPLTFGFQWRFQRSFPGGGFALAMVREPVFWLAVVAVLIRVGMWRRGGPAPKPREVAAVAVLGWYVATIPFAYKQYVGPALMVSAVLIVGLDDIVMATAKARPRRLAYGALLAVAVVVAQVSATLSTLSVSNRESTERVERGVLAVVDAGLPVAMGQPGHPLTRRDSLRGTMCAFNPWGPDSGTIMAGLDLPPPLSRSTTTAGILEELSAEPPAVLSLRGFWCPFQKEALQGFLSAHSGDYVEVRPGIFARAAAVDVERLGALLAPPAP